MSPARLILGRHGQAHCIALGIIGGPAGCTGLTSHGRPQAGQLTERLSREHARRPFDAAYTTTGSSHDEARKPQGFQPRKKAAA